MGMAASSFQNLASACEPLQKRIRLVGDLAPDSDSRRAFSKAVEVRKALGGDDAAQVLFDTVPADDWGQLFGQSRKVNDVFCHGCPPVSLGFYLVIV